MKAFFRLFVLFGLLIIAGAPLAARADAQDFTFTSFDGDYYLSRDARHISHLKVHERLVAEFPPNQNHGILRTLPQEYDSHALDLMVDTVTDDTGKRLDYTVERPLRGDLTIKIGDPLIYVSGRQVYDITYHMDNVTTAAGDGFFWNINGTDWPQSFEQVTARVHLDPSIASLVNQAGITCLTGLRYSTQSQCDVMPFTETITAATRWPLAPRETLSVKIPFRAQTFAPYTFTSQTFWYYAKVWFRPIEAPILATLLIMSLLWFFIGRDARGRGVIVPQYEPPRNLSVLAAGIVLEEKFENKLMTAQILDLAVRGYVRIYDLTTTQFKIFKSRDYQLELLHTDGLRSDEMELLSILFDTLDPGAKVDMNYLQLKARQFRALGSRIAGETVMLGYTSHNPVIIRNTFIVIGVIFIFYQNYLLHITSMSMLIPGIIIIAFSFFMPARTKAGAEMREYLLGLKLFIQTAEAERIQMLQSLSGAERINTADPGQLIVIYERLLPYAVMFGLEKEWAAQLEPFYQTPPSWYSGQAAFSAGYLSGFVGNFTASSSASTGTGGFGGGAGGGGGGGGGGGW